VPLPASFDLATAGRGRPLPQGVQQKMEALFGENFADVRVHVGREAPQLGALAFTLGSHLYFAPGQYDPGSAHGHRLLGHELTHVVQQRAGRVRNPFGRGLAVVQDPGLEAEAERMGRRAALSLLPAQAMLASTRPGAAVRAPLQARPDPRPGAPRALQPLIAVAGPDRNDYALIKVALQLWKRQTAQGNYTYIRSLDQHTQFQNMRAGESLYIVGHGARDTGEIRGVPMGTLVNWLNDPVHGIPNHIGEIVILTCYSGSVYGGQSLAEKIATRLRHRHIPVRGAVGFSYGSPDTETTGLNSVLPSPSVDPAYTEFYSGNNVETMLAFLKTKVATARLVLTLEGGGRKVVNAGAQWQAHLNDHEIRSWARRFIAERDRIENRMRAIVGTTPGNYMSSKIRNLVRDAEFNRLIGEQKALFDEGELFLPAGTSFVTHVS
jgi:hypothetical protein